MNPVRENQSRASTAHSTEATACLVVACRTGQAQTRRQLIRTYETRRVHDSCTSLPLFALKITIQVIRHQATRALPDTLFEDLGTLPDNPHPVDHMLPCEYGAPPGTTT